MTWHEYSAKCAQEAMDGGTPVRIEDAVMESLLALPGPRKREEICSMVASRTGLSMAELMYNISHTLGVMKRRGDIYSPVRGYWAPCKSRAVVVREV